MTIDHSKIIFNCPECGNALAERSGKSVSLAGIGSVTMVWYLNCETCGYNVRVYEDDIAMSCEFCKWPFCIAEDARVEECELKSIVDLDCRRVLGHWII
jgi:predicted RNA-binding Zn-ribbon protein involved in translation (DUF1610 family)